MYGTIARMHPKEDRLAEFWAVGDEMRSAPMAGFVASYLFQPDHNPYQRPTVFLVAVFEDQATYQANADSTEQDARYRRLRELLEDDPEWMDGTFRG
jgi:quinol monooxygenase YgiN